MMLFPHHHHRRHLCLQVELIQQNQRHRRLHHLENLKLKKQYRQCFLALLPQNHPYCLLSLANHRRHQSHQNQQALRYMHRRHRLL
jgi:hypothetical protein